ncbi:MAG: 7-carboxy-7-deazaguanine synthase [Sphingomonadales bacterium]|nr:7-carboxy-7-deazaguanine synthase [Sphingomonadales bacterium]
MSYAVKEMFLTLQGEGLQAGRRAVFLRFAGCNLWTGREADRASAVCRFCDTDFVGTDGENGGKFATAEQLAAAAALLWGEEPGTRFLVVTGGEPMLQLDPPLVEALHKLGFEIAVESNGTLPATPGIDWLCISPKAGSEVVQRAGEELKLVWPQPGIDPAALLDWDFGAYLVQPMDCGSEEANAQAREAAIALVMSDSRWRLSLQTHKLLGLK